MTQDGFLSRNVDAILRLKVEHNVLSDNQPNQCCPIIVSKSENTTESMEANNWRTNNGQMSDFDLVH